METVPEAESVIVKLRVYLAPLVSVTAEVVEQTKGPKITILKYKNKTGYRKRMGHRAKLTQIRVTGIETK